MANKKEVMLNKNIMVKFEKPVFFNKKIDISFYKVKNKTYRGFDKTDSNEEYLGYGYINRLTGNVYVPRTYREELEKYSDKVREAWLEVRGELKKDGWFK